MREKLGDFSSGRLSSGFVVFVGFLGGMIFYT